MIKTADYRWDHPELAVYVKNYAAGDSLFHQGDMGDSFFIILQGKVELTAERDGQELMISLLEPGQMLGEKSILGPKPYKRFFGAKAKTEVKAACISAKQLDTIEQVAPKLVLDIYRQMCKITVDRLDRTDHLIKVLRPSDNIERLVYLIIHFCYYEGQKTAAGIDLKLTTDMIRYYVAMNAFEVEECLQSLSAQKIFVSKGNDIYTLTDQQKLIQSIESLREAVPNLKAI